MLLDFSLGSDCQKLVAIATAATANFESCIAITHEFIAKYICVSPYIPPINIFQQQQNGGRAGLQTTSGPPPPPKFPNGIALILFLMNVSIECS